MLRRCYYKASLLGQASALALVLSSCVDTPYMTDGDRRIGDVRFQLLSYKTSPDGLHLYFEINNNSGGAICLQNPIQGSVEVKLIDKLSGYTVFGSDNIGVPVSDSVTNWPRIEKLRISSGQSVVFEVFNAPLINAYLVDQHQVRVPGTVNRHSLSISASVAFFDCSYSVYSAIEKGALVNVNAPEENLKGSLGGLFVD